MSIPVFAFIRGFDLAAIVKIPDGEVVQLDASREDRNTLFCVLRSVAHIEGFGSGFLPYAGLVDDAHVSQITKLLDTLPLFGKTHSEWWHRHLVHETHGHQFPVLIIEEGDADFVFGYHTLVQG